MSRVADPDPHKVRSWIQIRIRGKSRFRIWICTEVEIQEPLEAQNRAVEGRVRSQWRLGGSKGALEDL
jgi:hypothetical protein